MKLRSGGLFGLLLGAAIFVLLGCALEAKAPALAGDFKASYYGARCFLQPGCDPYAERDVLRMYEAGEFIHPPESAPSTFVVTRYVYLPSAFMFTVPFAFLPPAPAHVVWMILTAVCLILAALLMWHVSFEKAQLVSGMLLGLLLANTVMLLAIGNPAGAAVAFCVIAVWCFLKQRLEWLGVFCLAISLALKPHDSGLVWLYFLLAGGTLRRLALRVVLVLVVAALPFVLLVTRVAPQWMHEMHSSLQWFAARGGINDPGPASFTGPSVIRAVDLQATISVFKDDPRIYDLSSYILCGAILLVWSVAVIRSRGGGNKAWLALAAVAALSMLPTYHRTYDAKLLLLTIPGCAIIWAERGLRGWLALLLTTSGILSTGDFSLALLNSVTRNIQLSPGSLFADLITVTLVRPTPLVLLAISLFYLWALARWRSKASADTLEGCTETPNVSASV